MKLLIGILAGVALLYTMLALFAEHLKRHGMFFPERFPQERDTAASLEVVPEEVYFTTPDGVRLHAWMFRAEQHDAPLLVYFHGNAGHIGYRGPTAAELARRGVSVFVFDYRGFGRSQGSASDQALHVDSLAAYDFATKHYNVPSQRVALYGESIGGGYAARVATQRKTCCVIVESTFPSLRRLADALYRPLRMGIFARGMLETARWLNESGTPVLVMHGKRDEVVPFSLGMELYDSLRVPKELFVSEGAGHSQIEAIEGDRFHDAIVSFVRKHAS